jgi:EAL domain-containing protein (putative c-di-GMP-specific phosphodiesterase class I)
VRKSVLTHIVHEEDGTSSGVWGPFTLRSAFQPIFAFHNGKLPVAAFEGLARPFRNGNAVTAPAFFAALAPIDKLFVETLTRTIEKPVPVGVVSHAKPTFGRRVAR